MEREERAVGSRVLAATVGPGINFENLQDPVTIILRVQPIDGMVRYLHYILSTLMECMCPSSKQYIRPNSEVCVSWDFTLRDWTTFGCTRNGTNQDGVVTCNCNHLTNFALLVVSELANVHSVHA